MIRWRSWFEDTLEVGSGSQKEIDRKLRDRVAADIFPAMLKRSEERFTVSDRVASKDVRAEIIAMAVGTSWDIADAFVKGRPS